MLDINGRRRLLEIVSVGMMMLSKQRTSRLISEPPMVYEATRRPESSRSLTVTGSRDIAYMAVSLSIEEWIVSFRAHAVCMR